MKHLRIFVAVASFWKPCVFASDMTDDEAAAAEVALAEVETLTHGRISHTISDGHASTVTSHDALNALANVPEHAPKPPTPPGNPTPLAAAAGDTPTP